MQEQYVLVSVINSTKAFKKVKKKLSEIGYDRFTAIDSIGSTELLNDMEFSNMFSNSLSEMDNNNYNKTLLLVLPNEEQVEFVMDELEKILNMDPKKPGKGIMFTFPIITAQGVRFDEKETMNKDEEE
jgi:nitrogen regulatory protein PII